MERGLLHRKELTKMKPNSLGSCKVTRLSVVYGVLGIFLWDPAFRSKSLKSEIDYALLPNTDIFPSRPMTRWWSSMKSPLWQGFVGARTNSFKEFRFDFIFALVWINYFLPSRSLSVKCLIWGLSGNAMWLRKRHTFIHLRRLVLSDFGFQCPKLSAFNDLVIIYSPSRWSSSKNPIPMKCINGIRIVWPCFVMHILPFGEPPNNPRSTIDPFTEAFVEFRLSIVTGSTSVGGTSPPKKQIGGGNLTINDGSCKGFRSTAVSNGAIEESDFSTRVFCDGLYWAGNYAKFGPVILQRYTLNSNGLLLFNADDTIIVKGFKKNVRMYLLGYSPFSRFDYLQIFLNLEVLSPSEKIVQSSKQIQSTFGYLEYSPASHGYIIQNALVFVSEPAFHLQSLSIISLCSSFST